MCDTVELQNILYLFKGSYRMSIALNTLNSINQISELNKGFDYILKAKNLHVEFQPIFDLKEGKIYGYEGLTRGPLNSPFYSPLELFGFAEKRGQLYETEKLARELSIKRSRLITQGNEKLFINISSQVVYDPHFTPGHTMSLLKEFHLSPSDIVFEITERSAIKDFAAFTNALNHYRDQGFKIAIDDAGAGYSSLQAISEIKPDYIKIDRSLISNVHLHEIKYHILEAFVEIAKKMKSTIIAEGIEHKEELEKVIELGIHCGQGYYLAKPQFPITKINKNMKKEIKNLQKSTNKSFIVHLEDELVLVNLSNQIIKRIKVKDIL